MEVGDEDITAQEEKVKEARIRLAAAIKALGQKINTKDQIHIYYIVVEIIVQNCKLTMNVCMT